MNAEQRADLSCVSESGPFFSGMSIGLVGATELSADTTASARSPGNSPYRGNFNDAFAIQGHSVGPSGP